MPEKIIIQGKATKLLMGGVHKKNSFASKLSLIPPFLRLDKLYYKARQKYYISW